MVCPRYSGNGDAVTYSQFWAFVDASRAASGGDEHRQCELLTSKLAELPCLEIADFDEKLHLFFRLASDRAETVNGGLMAVGEEVCDDAWTDWRAWLISRGQETYFAGLMAREFTDLEVVWEQSNEALLYVPYEALQRRLGAGEDDAFHYMSAHIDTHSLGDRPVELLAASSRRDQPGG